MWRMPLGAVGFHYAQSLKEAGVKNVERKKNWKAALDEMKKQLAGKKE